jgi:hypothetical protein
VAAGDAATVRGILTSTFDDATALFLYKFRGAVVAIPPGAGACGWRVAVCAHKNFRRMMKYLCLAYGDEKDWNALAKSEQDELLAQDEVLRRRGGLMAAVQTPVTTVRAWDGTPTITEGAFAISGVPLAGFCIIEADDLNEVIHLVAQTPCARAKGAIEVRQILAINDFEVMNAPD